MRRTFAGILGSIAFTISIVHGWITATPAARVMTHASIGLLVFAIVGALAGQLAASAVEEGVSNRLHEAMSTKRKS